MGFYESAKALEAQCYWMHMQLTLATSDEDRQMMENIIHDLRMAFFDRYMSIMLQYAYPWDKDDGGSKMVDCDLYVLDHRKKAIRSFDGLYYIVNVLDEVRGVSIRTECPDDLPDRTPDDGFLYPEFAIASYMKSKCINMTQWA